MTWHRAFAPARIVGHCAWWVFVVATLFDGGLRWTGIGAHGLSVGASAFNRQSGWTAYTPLSDSSPHVADLIGSPHDPWTTFEVLSATAFAVVLVAAVIEALSVRRVVPGIATVAAPCVAFGLLLLATPGTFDSFVFDAKVALIVVLAAVAVREVWARGFARARRRRRPRVPPDNSPSLGDRPLCASTRHPLHLLSHAQVAT